MPGKKDVNLLVPTVAAIQRIGASFQTNNAEHYVPVFTLSVNDNNKF